MAWRSRVDGPAHRPDKKAGRDLGPRLIEPSYDDAASPSRVPEPPLDGVRGPTRRHIHTVVRAPNGNDYGQDLLRQHYDAFRNDPEHGHATD
jgi:hypothetical protein